MVLVFTAYFSYCNSKNANRDGGRGGGQFEPTAPCDFFEKYYFLERV